MPFLRLALRLGLAAGLVAPLPAAADDPFEILSFPARGRTVAGAIAELDGDGRPDLLTMNFSGVPPDERREIHARFQRPDGSFGVAADLVLPLPPDAAAYDLAPLAAEAPASLLLLRRDRLTVLVLRRRTPAWRDITLPGETIALAPDERGLDRLALVRAGLGDGPRLTVPGAGKLYVARPSGALVAQLELGGRANYFISPRPGPLVGENELEIYFDQPRVEVGDVDGDGLGDVVATQRHEIRVFRQLAGGELSPQPDRTIALRRISPTDHVRGSGSVRTAVTDIDGDGRVDLLVTHAAEGLMDARSETSIHLNRGGEWNLAEPDQRFETRGGFATEQLLDLDSDGRVELISVRVPLSVLELAEILITRSVDANVAIRRPAGSGTFAREPDYQRKFSISFNFETFRPRGFVGNLRGDWNGDGLRDLLLSGDGEALEIYLGAPAKPFAERVARQSLDTSGRLGFGDVDGDGLPDFVLFDPRRPDVPFHLVRNRGVLPGTPRRQELKAAP